MAGKYIGIDIGSQSIKFALVTAGFRGSQLLAEDMVPTQDDRPGAPSPARTAERSGERDDRTEKVLHAIDTALAALVARGWHHYPVAVSLPGWMASFRSLRFPFSDARRVSQALSFQLDEEFPRPLAELEVDHCVVGVQGAGSQVLVVALERAVVDQVLEKFSNARVELKLVTVGPLASAQCMVGPVTPLPGDASLSRVEGEGASRPAALLVDLGDGGTDLILLSDRGPLAVRSLRRGGRHLTAALQKQYGFTAADAEAAKHANAFLPARSMGELTGDLATSARTTARALEPVLREIEHTRMWARAELGFEITEIRLAGGGANLRGLGEYFSEQLELPASLAVATSPSIARLTTAGGWPRMSTAIGAAMGAARKPLIVLGQGTRAEREEGWIQQQFGTVVVFAAAALALFAIDTWMTLRTASAQRELYADELAELSMVAFGSEAESSSDVEELLAAVDSAETTSLVPERGALDVLEMLTKAAAPTDLAAAQAAEARAAAEASRAGALSPSAEGDTGSETSGGNEAVDPATGEAGEGTGGGETGDAPAAATGAPPAGAPPLDIRAGIVVADQLEFQTVDIRELKIQLKVTATRAAAQDRLAVKLEELGCIKNIQKGKVTDRDGKKVFEMSMDNGCYRSTSEEGGKS